MISVRHLTASFGQFSLNDICLELPEGRGLAILGPSGAGKTLLLETVIGARKPRQGQVLLRGVDVTDSPPEHRKIAYIPQDLALFPHLTVRENLLFGLPDRKARRHRNSELAELVEALRIGHLMERRDVRTLSGGEQQRVALARALIVQPRVLFLDEPFCALDASTRTDLLQVFRELRQRLAMTMFLVTHDLEEAAFLADDIALILNGRLVQAGARDEVLQKPRTVPVARFLNYRNILAANVARDLALDVDGADAVAIHPDHVKLLPMLTTPPMENHRGQVRDVVVLNNRAVVTVELSSGVCVESSVPRSQVESHQLRSGSPVVVHLPEDHLIPLLER